MADRLNHSVAVLLLLAAFAAAAQTGAADPFRPPLGVADASPAAGEFSGPVLQSVLMPKKGRPVAIIGGQQVRLGESYGDRRLIRLSEREAVLEGPEGMERLMLTPGIEKTNVSSKTSKRVPAVRRAQGGE